MKRRLILSIIGSMRLAVVESSQHIKLSTSSAKLNLAIATGREGPFTTNEQFRFESALSELFHTELSSHADKEDADYSKSRVIATSVHVERMQMRSEKNGKDGGGGGGSGDVADEGGGGADARTLKLQSIVSVTFSDVGLYKALKVAPIAGGVEEKTTPDVASILAKYVTPDDVLQVLVQSGLDDDAARVSGLSFTDFDRHSINGASGVTATETDIVTKKVNDGWPMFFAGMMITFLCVSIAAVSSMVYKKEFGHWPFMEKKACYDASDASSSGSSEKPGCNGSVHYKGDVDDIEVATTASGVLGGKGHHPLAESEMNDENSHPNSGTAYRRKGRGTSSDESAFSPESVAMSVSSKHPLGIRSMRKLSFLTPQKSKSDQMKLYDMERLTRT